MNSNNWEDTWRKQEAPHEPVRDIEKLTAKFETQRRRQARALFRRDVIEASAGVFVAILFGHKGWQMGGKGWPIAITVAIALVLAGFFVRERFRARKQRLGPDAPILEKLQADIAELRHQKRLLLNIAYWYLAPIFLSMAIFGVTLAKYAPTPKSRDPVFLTVYWTFVALLNWGIWAINRRAVRKKINPRIEELEKLRMKILTNP
jgi:hypothetical protein